MHNLIGAALLLAAVPAFADDPAPDPNAGGAPAGAPAGGATPSGGSTAAGGGVAETTPPKFTLGGGLELSPTGSINPPSPAQSIGTGLAYGVDVTALYAVHPMIAVGVAPRYVMGIKASNPPAGASTDSASMIDLRAVVAVHKDLKPKVSLFGYGGLGYAMIKAPSGGTDANGLDISFGAGAGYQLAPKLVGTVGVGYEIGLEKESMMGMDFDAGWNHLMINLGVMYALK
jgi:opacity protein-like surface antigen